jgi:hypothetical protein
MATGTVSGFHDARRDGLIDPAAGDTGAVTAEHVVRFGALELTDGEAKHLTDSSIVNRLVESGLSRLSAERIVAVERNNAEPGRARSHLPARASAAR